MRRGSNNSAAVIRPANAVSPSLLDQSGGFGTFLLMGLVGFPWSITTDPTDHTQPTPSMEAVW